MDERLSEMYINDGLFSKIIDAPAEEATLRGFTINCDKDVAERVSDELEFLDWDDAATRALKWMRLFGGSLAVLSLSDGKNPDKPINYNALKSVDNIKVYDCRNAQPLYNDLSNEITAFQIKDRNNVFVVNASRCLIFRNSVMPEATTQEKYRVWGVPEYDRMCRELQEAEGVSANGVKMLQQAVQAIHKVHGLSDMLATDDGEKQVLQMLETLNTAKGAFNTVIIDKADNFTFKALNMANLSEAVGAAQNLLSAVSGIPEHILWGKKGKHGLNSYHTEGDKRIYNANDRERWIQYVQTLQEKQLKANTEKLVRLLLTALYNVGDIEEVPKFSIKFKPIYSDKNEIDTELKKAKTQLIKAQTLQTLKKICD